MEASENRNSKSSDDLPKNIIGKLDRLYPQLVPVSTSADPLLSEFGAPTLELPTLDHLSSRVSACSFEVFPDPTSYLQSPRAKGFVSWSPPRSDVYRVFFDSEAKKVCVELNGKRWDEIHSKLEDEVLFCDILRTLIWVLICEVELFEARESEKAADTVTAEVTEIIIP